jgi:glycosyltransferase involved in cell wall biosynthesis
MKKIFFVAADDRACGWYRCNVPAVELKMIGYHALFNSSIRFDEIPLLDVLVLQRSCTPEALEAVDYANSLGKTTVFEIDDDFWNLDRNNPSYEYWNEPGVLKTMEDIMKRSQIVTTTTEPLAKLLSRFNKNIAVLPNMLPGEVWQVEKPKKKPDDPVVIGWAGGTSHWEDLKVLGGTIEQLLDEYENVEFHIAGAAEVPFYQHERAKGLEAVPIFDYAELLKDFDIGLAPLTGIHFNKCKSDLKFLEYSMLGIPSVVSKVDSYTASVAHGENGFLAKNSKDWLKYLRRLIEDEELRRRIGANAKAFAETRTIEKNIGLWEKAYGLK